MFVLFFHLFVVKSLTSDLVYALTCLYRCVLEISKNINRLYLWKKIRCVLLGQRLMQRNAVTLQPSKESNWQTFEHRAARNTSVRSCYSQPMNLAQLWVQQKSEILASFRNGISLLWPNKHTLQSRGTIFSFQLFFPRDLNPNLRRKNTICFSTTEKLLTLLLGDCTVFVFPEEYWENL